MVTGPCPVGDTPDSKQVFSAVFDECVHGHPSVRVDESDEPFFWVDIDALDQLIDTLTAIRTIRRDNQL